MASFQWDQFFGSQKPPFHHPRLSVIDSKAKALDFKPGWNSQLFQVPTLSVNAIKLSQGRHAALPLHPQNTQCFVGAFLKCLPFSDAPALQPNPSPLSHARSPFSAPLF
jgi:hypothetical protein